MSRFSPQLPIRTAIAGIGGFGSDHHDVHKALEKSGKSRVVATCDPALSHLEEICLLHNFAERKIPTYEDFDAMLVAHSGEIDLGVVVTPIQCHAPMHKAFVRNGSACYLEKPPTLDPGEMTDSFRQLPLEKALNSNFGIAHFNLSQFDQPGKFLHGFEGKILTPWKEALAAQGFTWERCYPICFVSGKGCSTNYHMDFSHVLAWQISGTKRFCGLHDPDHWADRETRVHYDPAQCEKPGALTENDAECFLMEPGAVLWNTFLTPHWVEAGDSVAMSINISHGGLRLNGHLCPHEEELVVHRAAHQDSSPKVQGSY